MNKRIIKKKTFFQDIIPYEIFLEIQSFLGTNEDVIALKQTCKWFAEVSNKWGYLRSIDFNMCSSSIFLNKYIKHLRCLTYIQIEDMFEPHLWIPADWTKHMSFQNCAMGSEVINPRGSKTETLDILDCSMFTNKPLKINWRRLPNLKHLIVKTYDFDFTGLDECKELRLLSVKLGVKRTLPNWIADLPKLESIETNCCTELPLHFISPCLKRCFVRKKQSFTSVSEIVPEKHLMIDFSNGRYFTPPPINYLRI